jgi:UPF0716 family protein affecting phage T7 exclusion
MEKEGFFVQVKEMIEDYVDDRLLLFRLQATEKAAKASATLFITAIVGALCLILFMIISFIAGYYLSKAVDSYPGGFAILAGIYILLIFVVLWVHKKHTSKMIIDAVIKSSFNTKETWTNEV